MAVTEILRGIGSWGVQLKEDTPKDILDALQWFGHIAVSTGRIDPVLAGDAGLAAARYVGIYRGKGASGDQFSLVGPGLAAWLGDEDGKGEIFETAVVLNHDFEDAIPLLLPDSIIPGTIFNINPGSPFVGQFQYVSPREAIDYICQTVHAEWRVNNNGTLDAGLESQLFKVIPEAAIWRKGYGADMFMEALRGQTALDQDMNDFTTRVLLLASGTEASTVTATADINPGLNPYKDLHGNTVKLTRIVSESDTDATNAPARAQLQLNRFSSPRTALTMSTSRYDVKGTMQVGDYIWAFDPDVGIYDTNNEVVFKGERIWPSAIRLIEMTWPIIEGMSVAYRDYTGKWFDLTPYVMFESSDTTLVVGGYNRSLGGDGGIGGTRPIPDTSTPGVVVWNEDEFRYSVYQSPIDGNSKAQVELLWDQPLNVDGSVILDGDHYEVRWRNSNAPIYAATHDDLDAFTHAQLSTRTHRQMITYGPPSEWQTTFVPFSDQGLLLTELATNMPYEAQIRAVDGAKPPNYGDWSESVLFQTSRDTIPPAIPAPPSVAAGRINVQITHELGRADGGVFNLDADLHHFEVHGSPIQNFAPTDETLIGKVIANRGMMLARTPVVASLNVDNISPVWFKVIAVDNDGNASGPSNSVVSTAQLIDNAHISDLTVSKVTAGTILSNWLISAKIYTGVAPNARVEMASYGIAGYDQTDDNTFWLDSNTGNVWIKGQFRTGRDEQSRIIINPGNAGVPEMEFWPQGGLSGPRVKIMSWNYSDPRGVSNAGLKLTSLTGSGGYGGGEIEMGQTGIKVGHYNSTTGQWAYYWIDEQSRHALRGTFNASNYDAYSALVVGQSGSIPGGVPSTFYGSVSYGGPTLASAVRLILTPVNFNSGSFSQFFLVVQMDGTNQSGFTFGYYFEKDEINGGIYSIPGGYLNYWGYRV